MEMVSGAVAVSAMYDEYAAVYSAVSRHDVHERPLLRWLLEIFRCRCLATAGTYREHNYGHRLLLDVGCGSGAALAYLAFDPRSSSCIYVGLEPSAELAARARALLSKHAAASSVSMALPAVIVAGAEDLCGNTECGGSAGDGGGGGAHQVVEGSAAGLLCLFVAQHFKADGRRPAAGATARCGSADMDGAKSGSTLGLGAALAKFGRALQPGGWLLFGWWAASTRGLQSWSGSVVVRKTASLAHNLKHMRCSTSVQDHRIRPTWAWIPSLCFARCRGRYTRWRTSELAAWRPG